MTHYFTSEIQLDTDEFNGYFEHLHPTYLKLNKIKSHMIILRYSTI